MGNYYFWKNRNREKLKILKFRILKILKKIKLRQFIKKILKLILLQKELSISKIRIITELLLIFFINKFIIFLFFCL